MGRDRESDLAMGYRFRTLTLALLAVAACTCPPQPVTPQPDNPAPAPDAQPDDPPPGTDQAAWNAMDGAAQACAILKTLKCPEATITCAEDIRKLVTLGTWDQTQLLCVRQSRTVVRVRTCMVDCKQ